MDLESSIRDLVGTKYKAHGRTKQEGLDCYGLVLLIGKRLGIELPESLYLARWDKRHGLFEDNKQWFIRVEKPQAGDLITFSINKYVVHVGVMLDHYRFIHATDTAGVCLGRVDSTPQTIEGYYRWKS
jgi:cell wall-associated NlpC family hydrolase